MTLLQMWVTVLAVADLPQRWAAVMQNTGVFMFSIGAHYNRFSVWLFAAPIVIGMAILMGHWVSDSNLELGLLFTRERHHFKGDVFFGKFDLRLQSRSNVFGIFALRKTVARDCLVYSQIFLHVLIMKF